MAHKTDFKDALFEQRKYRMQSNPDGTVTPVDETEYSQEGDRVGAKYFNETGEALNDLENPIFEDYTSTVAPDPEIALGLIKSKASFKALFQNIKAALLGMVFKKNVLTSMEEVNANTDEGMVAGSLAVKELSRDLPIVKSVTGSFPSAVNNWSSTVAYPEGFTKGNCIPVAIRSKQGGSSREYYNATGAQQTELTDSGVRVYLESAGNAYVNGQFTVYLLKQ